MGRGGCLLALTVATGVIVLFAVDGPAQHWPWVLWGSTAIVHLHFDGGMLPKLDVSIGFGERAGSSRRYKAISQRTLQQHKVLLI